MELKDESVCWIDVIMEHRFVDFTRRVKDNGSPFYVVRVQTRSDGLIKEMASFDPTAAMQMAHDELYKPQEG